MSRRTIQPTNNLENVRPSLDEDSLFIEAIAGWDHRNALGEKCMNVTHLQRNFDRKKVNKVDRKALKNQKHKAVDSLKTCGSWTASNIATTEPQAKKLSMFQLLKCEAKHLQKQDNFNEKLPDFNHLNTVQIIEDNQNETFKPIGENRIKTAKQKRKGRIRAMSSSSYSRSLLQKDSLKQNIQTLNNSHQFQSGNTILYNFNNLVVTTASGTTMPQQNSKNLLSSGGQSRGIGVPLFKSFLSQQKKKSARGRTLSNRFQQKIQGRKLHKLLPSPKVNATIV